MKKGKLHTHAHARTHAHIYTSMYKLYQMTYKTSKQQINKRHTANQLTDLVLSAWMDRSINQLIN